MFNVVFCNSISTDIKFTLFTWAKLAVLFEHVCNGMYVCVCVFVRVCLFILFVLFLLFIFQCDTMCAYQLLIQMVLTRMAAPSFRRESETMVCILANGKLTAEDTRLQQKQTQDLWN